jgi:hypothetical protein
MTCFLMALHPRRWRERYGEEFAALLDDTKLSPAMVLNVMAHAAKLHVRAHPRALQVCGALVLSAFFETVSLRAGLTANILWAPTDPVRALALLATTGPWLALAGTALARW